MRFLHPGWFWLLLVVVPVVAMHARGYAAAGGWRKVALAALRVLAIVLLVAALARPVVQRRDSTSTTVLAIDCSSSLTDGDLAGVEQSVQRLLAERRPSESVRLVTFDAAAREVDLQPRTLERLRPAATAATRPASSTGSALADAMDLAGLLIRNDGEGKVVLFTDGRETAGDARAAAWRLAQRRIPLEVNRVGEPRTSEVLLESVRLPATGGIGATVEMSVMLQSSTAGSVTLEIEETGGGEIARSTHQGGVGRQELAVPLALHREGVCRYAVRVAAAADTLPDNNELIASIHVAPPLRVRIIEDNPDAAALAALRQLAGPAAQVSAIDPAASVFADELVQTDVLTIADVPAEAVSPAAQAAIRDAVTRGMGLFLTGGRRAFGPARFTNAPLAEVTPLCFPQGLERRDPSATLVVIIDTSGSMTGPRVSLAKEIARLALGRLKPHDKAGIVEFYGSKRWAAPIQSAANAIDLQRALNRLSAGGGTVILPAMEEAYYALQNVNTRTKHVLVLTDGGVETGAFEPLIRKMADHNMTLSTVMVGPGAHSAFLASLAHWGRGRFYAAPDRFNLPEIIVKQPENSLSLPYVEQPSKLTAAAGRAIPLLDGIDLASCPALHGYVESSARPTADTLLSSELGHPILARWQYGLGNVVVWTSQMGGEWSGDVMQWPSAGRMFSNLLRSLAGVRPENALRMRPACRCGSVEVDIGNLLADSANGVSALEVVATREDDTGSAAPAAASESHRWTVDPYAPHRWNVRMAGLLPGTYRLQARSIDGALGGAAAVTVNNPREVSALAPDDRLLGDLAKIAGTPLVAQSAPPPQRVLEIWPILAGLFLPVFLVHVLLRRWPGRTPSTALAASIALLVLLGRPGSATAGAEPAAATSSAETRAQSGAAGELVAELTAALAPALNADGAAADAAYAQAARICLTKAGSLEPLIGLLQPQAETAGPAAWLLASAARDSGQLALARDTLAGLADREPGRFEVVAELARVEEWLGNDKGALARIEQALQCPCRPEQRQALLVRAAAIQHDLGQSPESIKSLEDILAAPAISPEMRHLVGHYATLLGDLATAEKTLIPAGGGKEQFHDHLLRGLVFLAQDRPEDARREYESAYELAPLDRDRRFALERVIASVRHAGTLDQLARDWQSEPDLSPDRLQALVALLNELGQSRQLLELLERPAVASEHRALLESPEFQTQLVSAALGSGDARQAEAAYLRLVERFPQQVQWRISLARLWLMDDKREQATQFLMQAVASFEDSGALMALAEDAARVSLDDVAVAGADKAAGFGLPQEVRSGLFKAGLIRQRGEGDKAIALVRELIPTARKDPKLLQLVAETLERYGDKVEALRLLEELYDLTGAEDTLLQVAYLLEENQRYGEAYELWSRLWSTTQVAARSKQAEQRLLDLASKTSKLADLVIDLEERIAAGTATERELKLLIGIYTTAGDPVSAAEILQEYAARSGSEVRLLESLAKVYLDCEQFGRCNATLRRLVELDPANALDYLQQIAVLAMERKQPLQARRVLAEMRARAGDDELTDEFSAGVLDMTGQHEDAARSYQRVLNRHPDRIESWLLWGNAMKACGRTDAAVGRFQVLVEEAGEDDLFTVAVDGLLNLEAKPAALRSALRRVYARMAASPNKVFLYQLANDLLDALGDTDHARTILEQCVAVGGERRSALLRELMESAKSANDLDRQVEYGRSLVALGEELPPLVFLDLGDALLKKGQLALAERVFERASIDADYSAIQQRVATSYEDVNRTADADRIIRGLLMAEPDNVPLLVRSGSLNEQTGNHEVAFGQYYRAADLMLRRLPGFAQSTFSKPAESERSRFRAGRAANVDEITQYFESAGNGLVGTARTQALRDRLQRDLLRRIDEELATLRETRRLMPRLSANPRLEKLVRFLRQVAFSLHVPEVADRVDRRLLATYPNDTDLRALVVTSRAEWGLYNRAAAFGETPTGRQSGSRASTGAANSSTATQTTPARPTGSRPAPVDQVDLILADLGLADRLIADGGVTADLADRLLPALLMAGRLDQARRLIASAPPAENRELVPKAARMMATAIAIDDMEGFQRWLGLWIERSVQLRDAQSPTAAASSLERCVRMAFPALDSSQRFGLVQRLDRVLPRLDAPNQLAVRLFQLEICEALDVPYGGLQEFASEAAKNAKLPTSNLARLIELVPAEMQVDLLRTAVSARKPAAQRDALLSTIGLLTRPVDARFREAVLELMDAAPKQRMSVNDILGWVRNTRHADLVLAIAEKLLSETPDAPAVLVAAGLARESAGRHDEAAILAREAMEALSAARQVTPEEASLVGLALSILRPAERDAYVLGLAEQYEIEAPTSVQTFILGLALNAAGRDREAIDAFRKAYEAQPSNRTFSRRLINTLKQTGRTVELARLLAATLTSSSLMESFEWRTLSEACYDLYDPMNALDAARKDGTILSPVSQMRAVRAMGRDGEALAIFRRAYIQNRDKGFFIDLVWPFESNPGGLLGYDPDDDELWTTRRRMYEALADVPWAEEEYSVVLQAARPGRKDIDGLISGLIGVARLTDGWSRLTARLESVRKADAMTVKDQALLIQLASARPSTISDELLRELDRMRLHLDPTSPRPLFALAQVYLGRGRLDEARGILHYLLAAGVEGQPGVSIPRSLEYLDAYLATLPEADRGPRQRHWLALIKPTRLDPLNNEYGIECVDRLAAAGDAAWRDELEALRRRADGVAGDPRYRLLRIALARRYAALGDRNVFSELVEQIFDSSSRADLYFGPTDPRRVLPDAATATEPAVFVDIVVACLERRLDEGSLVGADFIRSICLLAEWCRTHQLPEKAVALVGRAESQTSEPSGAWLFLSDALRALGQDDKALDIEVRLLESDLLPVVRVPDLLARVEKSRGQALADALAVRVAGYSSHPDVLPRAIRSARASGNARLADELTERLEQVSPPVKPATSRPASQASDSAQ